MLIRWFSVVLRNHPWKTQVITTGVIMASGDLISQTVVEKKEVRQIEPVRVARFACVGLFFVGPVLKSWYLILERICGVRGVSVGLKKMLLDQGIFAPFFLLNFLVVMGTVQNETVKEIQGKIKNDFMNIMKANYTVWPLVQLVTFYTVPFNYRLIFVNTVAVFWNAYLSWKANRHDSMK